MQVRHSAGDLLRQANRVLCAEGSMEEGVKQKGSRAMLARNPQRSVHGQEAGNMQADKHTGEAGPPLREDQVCISSGAPLSFLGTGQVLGAGASHLENGIWLSKNLA